MLYVRDVGASGNRDGGDTSTRKAVNVACQVRGGDVSDRVVVGWNTETGVQALVNLVRASHE